MPGYDPVRDITSSSPSPAANPGPQLYQQSHSAGSASNSPSGPAAASSPDDRRAGAAWPTPPPPSVPQYGATAARQVNYLSTPTADYRRGPGDGRPSPVDEPRPSSSSSAGGRGSLSLLLNAAEQMGDHDATSRSQISSRQSPPASWAQLSGPGRSAPAIFGPSRSSSTGSFERPLPLPASSESPSSRYRSEIGHMSSQRHDGHPPSTHHQPYPPAYHPGNGVTRSGSPMGLSPRSAHPVPHTIQQQHAQPAFSPSSQQAGPPFAFVAPLPPQHHTQPSRRATALGLTSSEPLEIPSSRAGPSARGPRRPSGGEQMEFDSWASRRADEADGPRRPTIVPHNTWPKDESEIVLNSPQDALRPYSRGGNAPSVLQDPRGSMISLPPGFAPGSSRMSISGWSGEPPDGNSRPDTPRTLHSREQRGSHSSWTSGPEGERRGSVSASILDRAAAAEERRLSDLSAHTASSRRPSNEEIRPRSSSSNHVSVRNSIPEGFTGTMPSTVMSSASPQAGSPAANAGVDKKSKKKPTKKELAAAEKAAALQADESALADESNLAQPVAKGKRKRESMSGDLLATNGKVQRKTFDREATPVIEQSPSPPPPPQIFSPSPPREPSPPRGSPYNPRRKTAPFTMLQPLTREEAEWFRDLRNSKNPLRRSRQQDVPPAGAPGAANGSHGGANERLNASQSRDVAKDVAEHYNMRPNQRREARGESVILGLKSFNNWVKSILIGRFATRRPGAESGRPPNEPNGRVLDMGCGKGGDLIKWDRQRIAEYVGLDLAEKSIRDFQDRIRERNRPLTFHADLYAFDCFNAPISSVLSRQQLEPMFDCVSMQFCIHYAFENASKVRMMLENVSRYLRPGGKFFGTTVSDRKLLERLDQVPRGASQPVFGNQYYNVVFREREHKGVFGHAYRFQLTDAIDDCEEYVVNWENFEELAREYRLKCIYRRDFDDLLEEELEDRESRALAVRMNVISREGDLFMDEGQFEVCSVYTAFAFEKTSGPI